jgi:hypothetical protein
MFEHGLGNADPARIADGHDLGQHDHKVITLSLPTSKESPILSAFGSDLASLGNVIAI